MPRTIKLYIKNNSNKHFQKYLEEKKKTYNIEGIKERDIVFETNVSQENPSFMLELYGYDGKRKMKLDNFEDFDEIFAKIDQMPIRQAQMKKPKKDVNYSLYSNDTARKSPFGYANANKAKQTLSAIKSEPKTYQHRVINTMYNRAKYHKSRTPEMEDAMKVYKGWLKKNNYKV